MKVINLIMRLMVSPFVLGLILVKHVYSAVRHLILFILYGGEFIAYTKDDVASIAKIFNQLKQTENENTGKHRD